MEIQEESQNSRRNRVQVKQGKGREEGWKGRGRKEGCVATRATAESQYDSPVRV